MWSLFEMRIPCIVVVSFLIVCCVAHEKNRVIAVENAISDEDTRESFRRDASGSCSPTVDWAYDATSHTVTISGSGDTACTSASFQP